MFRSKHSGWTWEGKRTPYGDGGGWLQDIGGSIASWDPHVTEGTHDWLAENGWMIPAAVVAWMAPEVIGGAAGGAEAGAGAGDVFAGYSASGSSAGTAGSTVGSYGSAAGYGTATSLGNEAFNSAIANGASQSEAQAAGDAAYNSYMSSANQYVQAGGNPSNLTQEMIQYANASKDPIQAMNQIANLTPEEFTQYTKIIGDAGSAGNLTAGQDLAELMKSYPNLSSSQLEDILRINYGTDPMLSADAANLASQGYSANTIDQVLGYSYSAPELANTGIESSALNPSSGMNLSDTLKTAKRATDVAKLLKQGATSGLTTSLGKLAQGANPMGMEQLQVVRGNQNPFTYTQQQPIQDTKQAQLASLLKQG